MSRFLDFFFGGGTKPQPTTTTSIQTSKLPEEIAPYVTQVLEEAQKQYELARDEGYQKYPGETIAPMTQAEKDAIAGLQSLVGGQEKYLTEAEEALRGIDTEFTAEQAEKFMSPYQQAVVDVEKRQAQEDFQRRIMPQFEQQAVEAGGMSGLGSRAGVQAAQLGSAFSQQLGDIQTKGSQKAYEDAYRQFTDQGVRQRARADDLQNMGLTRFQTGLAEQGLAQDLAQADRAESQLQLDKAFREYTEQQQYPESELAQFSSFVYGNPFLQTPDKTTTRSVMGPPTTSVGQQLLGLGLGGLNIFGRGGGFDGGFNMGNIFSGKYPGSIGAKTGGKIAAHMKAGGGLGSLPVVNRRYGDFGKGGYNLKGIPNKRRSNLTRTPPRFVSPEFRTHRQYTIPEFTPQDPRYKAKQAEIKADEAAQRTYQGTLENILQDQQKALTAADKKYEKDFRTGLGKLSAGLRTGTDRKIGPDFGRATKAVLGDKSGMGIVGLLGLASAEMFEGQDEDIKEAQKIIRDAAKIEGQLELDLLGDVKKSEKESAKTKASSDKAIAESQKNIATLATKGASKLIDVKQNIIDSDVGRVRKKADIELVNAQIVNLNAQAEKRLAEAFAKANEKDYPKLNAAVDNAVRNGWKDLIMTVKGVSVNENGTLDIKGDQFGDPKKVSELRATINQALVNGVKHATGILMDDTKRNDVGAISSAIELMSKEINKFRGGTPTTEMSGQEEADSLKILRSNSTDSAIYNAELKKIKEKHGAAAVKKITRILEKK